LEFVADGAYVIAVGGKIRRSGRNMRVSCAIDTIDPQRDIDDAVAGVVEIAETEAVLASRIDAAWTGADRYVRQIVTIIVPVSCGCVVDVVGKVGIVRAWPENAAACRRKAQADLGKIRRRLDVLHVPEGDRFAGFEIAGASRKEFPGVVAD